MGNLSRTKVRRVTTETMPSSLSLEEVVFNTDTNELFKEEYNKVLDRLTIKYSGIPIFTMIPFKQTHASVIKECVKDRGIVI